MTELNGKALAYPVDKIAYLRSLDRVALIDIIRNASYVEIFQMAAANVTQQIKNDQLVRYHQSDDYRYLQQKKIFLEKQRDQKINAVNKEYESIQNEIHRIRDKVSFWNSWKWLTVGYLLLSILLVLPLILIIQLISGLGHYYWSNSNAVMIEFGILLMGYLLFIIFRQIKLSKYRCQINDLKAKLPRRNGNFWEEYEKQMPDLDEGLDKVKPNRELLDQRTELREYGERSLSFRGIFPRKYQNLNTLNKFNYFLENGLATTWSELVKCYDANYHNEQLETAVRQLGRSVNDSLDNNSNNIINAINDLNEFSQENIGRVLRANQESHDANMSERNIINSEFRNRAR